MNLNQEAEWVEAALLRIANGPDVYCRQPDLMRTAAEVIQELRERNGGTKSAETYGDG